MIGHFAMNEEMLIRLTEILMRSHPFPLLGKKNQNQCFDYLTDFLGKGLHLPLHMKTFEVQDYLVKELSQTYGISEVVWMGLNDDDEENNDDEGPESNLTTSTPLRPPTGKEVASKILNNKLTDKMKAWMGENTKRGVGVEM